MLVFLSGEREIRDTADALRKLRPARHRGAAAVRPAVRRRAAPGVRSRTPAGASCSPPTSPRPRSPCPASATSSTPAPRASPGTATARRCSGCRSSRSRRRRPTSARAAAGGSPAGICIRLYSEEDFDDRPEYTDPEILRTNLASVILQMTALGLGDIAAFPFIDPPDRRNITAGIQLLEELGRARRATGALTRSAASSPSCRSTRGWPAWCSRPTRNGCVREVLVIAAALSIQDPRERPVEKQQAADEKHARFADPTSDFLAYLNLWNYLQEQQKERTSSGFRRMCRDEFLQLPAGARVAGPARPAAPGRARSLGVTDRTPRRTDRPGEDPHVAARRPALPHRPARTPSRNEYLGARGTKFAVVPRLGAVQEAAAVGHGGRTGGDVAAVGAGQRPHRAGVGRAARRPPGQARVQRTALELQAGRGDGLREGDAVRRPDRRPAAGPATAGSTRRWPGNCSSGTRWSRATGTTHHRLLRTTTARCSPRSPNWRSGPGGATSSSSDEVLFDFYDQRVGAEVVSARHFDTWWKQHPRRAARTCSRSPARCCCQRGRRRASTPASFPGSWRYGGLDLPLTYRFEPGAPDDGVIVDIPLALLGQVTPAAVRVAGARAARGTGHRARSGRCRSRCAGTSFRCPTPCARDPRPPRRARRRTAARRARVPPAAAHRRADRPRGLGLEPGPRPPADVVPGARRERRGARRRARPRPR